MTLPASPLKEGFSMQDELIAHALNLILDDSQIGGGG